MAPFSTSLFDSQILLGSQVGEPAARSLILVLHGKGDGLDAYLEIDREMNLKSFDFLLLNGPMRCGDGFKWMNDEPRHARSLAVVRDQLFALIEELLAFGYQAQNILWLGHSQGGRVAADIVMHAPFPFMGIVGISSYVGFFDGWNSPAGLAAARKTPWLFTHGTSDLIIRPKEIRADIRQLATAKIPLTYREFSKGHDFDFKHEVPWIRRWIMARQDAKVAPAGAVKTPTRPLETPAQISPET